MSRIRASAIIIIVCAAPLTMAVLKVGRYLSPVSGPLGEGPRTQFPAIEFSESAWRHFLDDDFKIITDVRALPAPILQIYTEKGGSRLMLANPGQKFEVTDVIRDASMPRERLIFAGVAGDKCFVHYERGGYAHTYVVEFFGITSPDSVEPLWSGYCEAPAANIQDLRSQLIHGGCSHPPIAR